MAKHDYAVNSGYGRDDGGVGTGTPRKPVPMDEIKFYLHDVREETKLKWPHDTPTELDAAARFFLRLFEPQHWNESPSLANRKGDGAKYWNTPYIDRIKSLILPYFALTPEDQRIVQRCAKEGVHWRGGSMDEFYHNENSVYNELMMLRRMKADGKMSEYILRAKKGLVSIEQALSSTSVSRPVANVSEVNSDEEIVWG